MINSMTMGARSKPVAQLIRPALAPEKARREEKVAEPKMMSKAITVTFSAPCTEAMILLKVSLP